jgi:hypothetical protein
MILLNFTHRCTRRAVNTRLFGRYATFCESLKHLQNKDLQPILRRKSGKILCGNCIMDQLHEQGNTTWLQQN